MLVKYVAYICYVDVLCYNLPPVDIFIVSLKYFALTSVPDAIFILSKRTVCEVCLGVVVAVICILLCYRPSHVRLK